MDPPHHPLSLRARVLTALAPLVAVAGLVVALLASGRPIVRTALPREPHLDARCTWACHNHGCPHAARLPAALTADAGLFGRTIGALAGAGRRVSPRPGAGYRAVNLALFAVGWPGAMYVLAVVALRQRMLIRARRRRACR